MFRNQWIENVAWVLITTAAVLGIFFAYAMLSGCSAPERLDLSDAFARGIVKQTVEELKVVLGTSMLEMQNELHELLWETFYKITGVGAGGTAAIVGHRYTKSYGNVQKKAVNGNVKEIAS